MLIDLKTVVDAVKEEALRQSLFRIVRADDHRKWQAIRAIYKTIDTRKYDPYPVDWTQVFSPIEHMAWGEIRGVGLPFYPQLPIGMFFADFADPVERIVIECDGKDFHDPVRDAERDALMRADGWRVFRVPGADCVRKIAPPFESLADEGISENDERAVIRAEAWAMRTIDGLIWALSVVVYGCCVSTAMNELALRVLRNRSSKVH